MALPIQNLSLELVASTLGETKSLEACCTSLNVDRYGLDNTYCSGLTAKARLTKLREDKKLSFFKNYDPINADIIFALSNGDFHIYDTTNGRSRPVYFANVGSEPYYPEGMGIATVPDRLSGDDIQTTHGYFLPSRAVAYDPINRKIAKKARGYDANGDQYYRRIKIFDVDGYYTEDLLPVVQEIDLFSTRLTQYQHNIIFIKYYNGYFWMGTDFGSLRRVSTLATSDNDVVAKSPSVGTENITDLVYDEDNNRYIFCTDNGRVAYIDEAYMHNAINYSSIPYTTGTIGSGASFYMLHLGNDGLYAFIEGSNQYIYNNKTVPSAWYVNLLPSVMVNDAKTIYKDNESKYYNVFGCNGISLADYDGGLYYTEGGLPPTFSFSTPLASFTTPGGANGPYWTSWEPYCIDFDTSGRCYIAENILYFYTDDNDNGWYQGGIKRKDTFKSFLTEPTFGINPLGVIWFKVLI